MGKLGFFQYTSSPLALLGLEREFRPNSIPKVQGMKVALTYIFYLGFTFS